MNCHPHSVRSDPFLHRRDTCGSVRELLCLVEEAELKRRLAARVHQVEWGNWSTISLVRRVHQNDFCQGDALSLHGNAVEDQGLHAIASPP